MNNKLKSLIYLSCFILVSILYYQSTTAQPKEELANMAISQEADIIINPYGENLDRTQTH
ncbi:MAG: hypothetical protein WA810_06300 [Maribacter sp.]